MSKPRDAWGKIAWREVRLRSDAEVERLTVALVRESIAFQVKPEPDGWWRVRTLDMKQQDLSILARSAATEVAKSA